MLIRCGGPHWEASSPCMLTLIKSYDQTEGIQSHNSHTPTSMEVSLYVIMKMTLKFLTKKNQKKYILDIDKLFF